MPGEGTVKERLTQAGTAVHVIPFRGYHPRDWRRHVRAFRDLGALMRGGSWDIVHAHLFKSFILARIILRGRRSPRLVTQVAGTVHLQSRPLAAIDRMTLRWDTVLVGSCTEFAETYAQRGARHTAVSFYGCHTDRFDPATSGAPLRDRYGLTPSDVAVGLIAHMYPTRLKSFRNIGVKGHEVFIDAALSLAKQDARLRFFVVGDEFVGDGSYRRELERRAAPLVDGGRMHFLGHRTDMPDVIAGMDILVNPSLSESASYTMVEASLMRRPVIGSRVGGLPDTIIDGSTGLLVPPGDDGALAGAIRRLADDPETRHHMGGQGRSHVLEMFDITKTVSTVEEIYQRAVEL
ncbi:glycosyltransferase family 4 protein [Ruania halotolerans]|uniref:glycosyltransferase family 4 protein n=1 Tax=Ruania halotolerans TaxID=2897773 RepID=UPI001E60900C|nr:glycosyltransferase family 4 protein [Ruania halotolerans]UFU08318.1 glycosyltransferase family 4 protein [Ruania halotolerans]